VSALRPAIFLDRDGVLNAVVWRDGKAASPRSVEELLIEPDAHAALTALKAAGYLLLVVTNQPDIGRGLMTGAVLDALHARLSLALPLDAIAACRHDNADDCHCRKPKPGLILDLAVRFGVDLGRSWLVGDQDRDIQCGQAAGCQTILLERPYNSGRKANADHTLATLSQTVSVIVDTPTLAAAN
jgi:D-glycero-D-manno-heptose 1,7-bisphosphate phosphatase